MKKISSFWLKRLFGLIYTIYSIQKYNLNNEKLHLVFCTLNKFACEEI